MQGVPLKGLAIWISEISLYMCISPKKERLFVKKTLFEILLFIVHLFVSVGVMLKLVRLKNRVVGMPFALQGRGHGKRCGLKRNNT